MPSNAWPMNWKVQPTVNIGIASGRPTSVAPIGSDAAIIGMPTEWQAWLTGCW